jgi:hypothetical protein
MTFWDAGPLHIVEFPKLGDAPTKPKVPLQLAVCEKCWLVQLMHTTDPKYLYEEFHYRSGVNEMMRAALASIVNSALYEVHLARGDVVVDIGANDGTLLSFVPETVRVACEPAKNMYAMVSKYAEIIIPEFWSGEAYERAFARHSIPVRKAKIVFACAMFYDLENPVEFCKQVAKILDKNGVFVVQMNYLPTMLSSNGVDNIVQEHLTYFSLSTLIPVFQAAGLLIYKAETNSVNGGSLRVYACHAGQRDSDASVHAILGREYAMGLASLESYFSFTSRTVGVLSTLQKMLDDLSVKHKKVYAYGASTRGTTLLQLLRTDGRLIACAERDDRKIGRYMVGANLPIVSEDEFRKEAECGLVLPWHFLGAIQQREKEWLAKGNQMIVPLPYPRFVVSQS